ncbi:MAG: SDR family oxidoreductase [Proteobacteria bacterium]|nr:SDR family oxidoreductase [Pseudomonadota bacterium]
MTEVPTTIKDRKRVEKRREQIVRAAIKLFSRKGFQKTTLRDLAEESGLSLGNIYDYVGAKEDIIYLCHEFISDKTDEHLERSVENVKDPIAKLRRMVRAEFEHLFEQWADGVMLIYRDTHLLPRPFMKKLLQKERRHLEKFEVVLEECVRQGRLRDCNLRLTSNLIKAMIDSWVLKRWDLRGHIGQLEARRAIIDMTLNGLLPESQSTREFPAADNLLEGRSALVANGGTMIGQAVLAFLLSQGMRPATYTDDWAGFGALPAISTGQAGGIRYFPGPENEPVSEPFVNHIQEEHGSLDIYIHDLSVGMTSLPADPSYQAEACRHLVDNLRDARNIAGFLEKVMTNRKSGRIIFIAPWAWDRFLDPICYETVKGGVIALTRALAEKTAGSGVNVHCIVPGYIKTARPSEIQKQYETELVREIPAGHLGELEDITNAIHFLASDTSKYLTGHILKCTGGLD